MATFLELAESLVKAKKDFRKVDEQWGAAVCAGIDIDQQEYWDEEGRLSNEAVGRMIHGGFGPLQSVSL